MREKTIDGSIERMINNVKKIMEDYIPKIYGKHRRSAVLLPLIQVDGEYHVLYEVRSRHVSQPGDSSFPGGKVEADETYKEAAVRETMEELNLKRENIQVFGEMDYIVSERMIIRCFVGEIIGISVDEIAPNLEVETVYTLPLDYLIENKPSHFSVNLTPTFEDDIISIQEDKGYEFELMEHKQKIPYYDIEDHSLWGFTANLTERFIEIVRSESDDI